MAITTFIPSPSQTPGRLNMFNFKDFQVLVDYAHNPAGMRGLAKFITNLDHSYKVGIIAGIGDRRDEDNIEMGMLAGEMFDEVIIRQDKNLRGQSEERLISLLKEGIEKYDKNKKIHIIPSEAEAISYAIKNAKPNYLVAMCSDVVPDALDLVMKFKEEEAKELYG